jgi:dienelactone hydrolase
MIVLADRARHKQLQLRVTYPERGGPFPLILLSHAVGGARDDYQPLVSHWVSHGYVCLQPDHTDSRDLKGQGGQGLDYRNRAIDLSLLIDSLPEIVRKVPALEGRVDANRIGAAGHLIGAYASSLLVGMRVFTRREVVNLEDERVDAALLLSPQGRGQGLTEDSWLNISRPMLVIAGSHTPSRRTGNPPEWRTEPFTFAQPGDKYLLFVDGLSNHYAGLVDGVSVNERLAGWIMSGTLAFWDAYLKREEEPLAFLNSDGLKEASSGKARFRTQHRSEN